MTYCGIDFGTSNSAMAVPAATLPTMRLLPLEGEYLSMPTAVFYCTDADDLPVGAIRENLSNTVQNLAKTFGRAAVSTYIEGYEGRLMRSMKSILGTASVEQSTDMGNGQGVKYLDIIADYLMYLRQKALSACNSNIEQVVMGRPVFFIDDDPQQDAKAQSSLQEAAKQVGFKHVVFQYEPIAAAFDHEQHVTQEELVLVADIGGGTSDFSVVRVGPQRVKKLDRRSDILSNHGIHVAGTDFDRHISLAAIMPALGYGAFGPRIKGQAPRPVPARVYMDLATWHLINCVYQAQRMAELKSMGDFYGDITHHQRLMKTLKERLGHALIGQAEAAKIAVSAGGQTELDLSHIEDKLMCIFDDRQAQAALQHDIHRIVVCAKDTVKRAGVRATDISALFFTGGSTGLKLLTDALESVFPQARVVRGDRLGSVATGLGLQAKRIFG